MWLQKLTAINGKAVVVWGSMLCENHIIVYVIFGYFWLTLDKKQDPKQPAQTGAGRSAFQRRFRQGFGKQVRIPSFAVLWFKF